MERTVRSSLTGDVTEAAEVVLSIAVAHGPVVSEKLSVTVGGARLEVGELIAGHGTRLHTVQAPVGRLNVEYGATVTGPGPVSGFDPVERILYLRPSRYCGSDTLAAVATDRFGHLHGKDLLDAVTSWVGTHLAYVSGSSRPTDSAIDTYLSRVGICRDFAHLVITMLRACGMPARLAAVYAPGLSPMDFHAVAEALIDEQWWVVDATTLAPRSSLVRIATGRDAADTAFMTVTRGAVELVSINVEATVDQLPADDVDELVALT